MLPAGFTWANETDSETNDDRNTAEPYTDQYLDEFDADEIPIDIGDEHEGLPRSFAANYRTYVDAREMIRPLVEHGLDFLWYQETDGYGSFNATFEQLFNNDGRPNRDSQGERFQLENRDFVINENYAADTRLGHFRSESNRLLATSYRFFLPTTLLQGGTTRIHSDRAEFDVTAGYIGGLQGTAARGFRKTRGTLLGASGQFSIDDNWSASAQFWDTNDAGIAGRNHQVGGGAVQYLSDDLTQRHQLRGLKDSKGQFGSWYDGVSILGRWRHRYGAFHFERGLRWTDVQIDNDRQGLFWRGDFSSFRWRWTLGSEVSRNNLDELATVAGNVVTNSFVNGSWQFRRKTQIGGLVTVRTQHADSGIARGDGHTAELRAFLAHDFAFGLSRLELRFLNENLPAIERAETQLRWDHDWAIAYLDRFTTEFEFTQDTFEAQEVLLGIIAQKDLTDTVSGGLDFQLTHRQDENGVDSRAYNWGFGFHWLAHRDVTIDLSATAGRVTTDPVIGPSRTLDDLTVLLSVSFVKQRGRPARMSGYSTGQRGSGTIKGHVFFDTNRNGKRDGGERGLPRITVYLDGHFRAETNTAGEFEFERVGAGEHWLRIAVEEAPLPFGLEDESPQSLIVPIRGIGRIDFGLIEIE